MSKFHIPVLLKEAVDFLNVQKGEWYVDCNLGGGGHTAEILKRGGKVIGIDLDPEAIEEVARIYNLECKMDNGFLRADSENLILIQGNFVKIQEILKRVHPDTGVSGVLFDLGLSSYQLDTSKRGFSFQDEAPLDMRMDASTESAKAADLINGLHEKELADLFWKLGEEQWAKLIAKRIVEERKKKPIQTTTQLARIVEKVKRREGHIHPATKIFQALRIAVNDELNNLKVALPAAFESLQIEGNLVVISFHSLEDRIVKEFFKGEEASEKGKVLTEKPMVPSDNETEKNPRSRSAKLRAIEKMVLN